MHSPHVIEAIGRFFSFVDGRYPKRCWLWRGAITSAGYGCFSFGESVEGAHRFAYVYIGGGELGDLTIDHLCRNPACVNPNHLEAVTQAENNRRSTRWVSHCPRGHAYTEINTYRTKAGVKQCRECNRIRNTARNHTRRIAA